MFELISNMSGEVISRHRKLEAATAAGKRFQKGSRKDTFRPWRVEQDGVVVAKYGMFEATGYEDGGWAGKFA